MKKLVLTLIVLALVCTGVFAAGKSVTAGLAYGGYIIPQKLDVSENLKPFDALDFEASNLGKLNYVYDMGLGLFAGFDYVKENGLTIYDDVALNLGMKDNGENVTSKKYMVLSEYAGLGYTFYKNNFTFMAGAGLEAKIGLGLKNVFGDGAKFAVIGAGLRGKVSYAINEQFSVSVQGNAAFDFKVIHNFKSNTDAQFTTNVQTAFAANGKAGAIHAINEEVFARIMEQAKFVSGNLFVGCTYKF